MLSIRKELGNLGIITKDIQASEVLRFNKLTGFIEFDKDIMSMIDDLKIIQIINHLMPKIIRTEAYTDMFKEDLVKYLGETIAEEFLDTYRQLMRNANMEMCAYDTTIPTSMASLLIDYPLNVGRLYTLIIIFMYMFRQESNKQEDIYFYMNNYTRTYDYHFSFGGRLKELDDETKKNIIGSIWNCIIDIVSMDTINNELKGGE